MLVKLGEVPVKCELSVSKVRMMYYSVSDTGNCGHLTITDTPIIQIVAESLAKINYRCLTEINSHYYGLSLLRTLMGRTRGRPQ